MIWRNRNRRCDVKCQSCIDCWPRVSCWYQLDFRMDIHYICDVKCWGLCGVVKDIIWFNSNEQTSPFLSTLKLPIRLLTKRRLVNCGNVYVVGSPRIDNDGAMANNIMHIMSPLTSINIVLKALCACYPALCCLLRFFIWNHLYHRINSLRPSDAYMRR